MAKVDYGGFGVTDIDKLFGGEMPPGPYLIEVEPGTGVLAFAGAFLSEGFRHKNLCSVVSYDMPHDDLINKLGEFGVSAKEALDSGYLFILDMWKEGDYDPERQGPILQTNNLNDANSVLRLYNDLSEVHRVGQHSGKFTGSRVVSVSLSSMIMNFKFEPTYKLIKVATNLARKMKSRTLSILNPNMFDETVVAAFEHLYDGIIALTMKNVKGRFQRFVRIKESPYRGFCTDEVPYEIINNKPCLVTSFSEPISTFRNHLKLNADGSITLLGTSHVLVDNGALVDISRFLKSKVRLETGSMEDQIYQFAKEHSTTRLKTLSFMANTRAIREADRKSALESLVAYLSATGLGIITLETLKNDLISFKVTNCICARNEISDSVMHPYLEGVLAGVVESLLYKSFQCAETRSVAKGDDCCEFKCRRID